MALPEKKIATKPKHTKSAPDKIYVLPPTVPPGSILTEWGRRLSLPPELSDKTVEEEYNHRHEQVRATLQAMEKNDKSIAGLWHTTRQWSLDEFKRIYDWLEVKFNHDFFESEVSEESIKMVRAWFAEGKLQDGNGAIGMHLEKYEKGLGFCMLLKSNGSGLYATKDMALAVKKFDQFDIDRSIYVVGKEQTLHFKQVFKTLELLGFEKAKKCFHLPYGMVVLNGGKMSTRKGTVILFNQLKKLLEKKIHEILLAPSETKKKKITWAPDEIDEATHTIALATIKYGMLNRTARDDIVFDLDDWASLAGNTGPYLLYAYTRMTSILRRVEDPVASVGADVDYSFLLGDVEKEKGGTVERHAILARSLLLTMNNFWPVIFSAVQEYNPAILCNYLFNLCQTFSAWFEAVPPLISEKNSAVCAARLRFVRALSMLLQKGLALLGIRTLEKM